MKRTIVAVLGMLLLGAVGARAQDPVPTEFHVGERAADEPDSGAQLEVSGVDGGVTITATGQPYQSESFIMYRNRGFDGLFRKSASLSVNMGGNVPGKEFYISRWNVTYTEDGWQHDDLAIQVCGGKGVVLFAHYTDPSFCPGRNVFRVNGTLDVNGINVQDELAALKARIARLESMLTAAPPQPKPGPAMISCPGTHAACKVLPAGTYLKSWADGAFQ
jgi:hypothetical protein